MLRRQQQCRQHGGNGDGQAGIDLSAWLGHCGKGGEKGGGKKGGKKEKEELERNNNEF